jgi:hypothetical protein
MNLLKREKWVYPTPLIIEKIWQNKLIGKRRCDDNFRNYQPQKPGFREKGVPGFFQPLAV